MTPKPDKQPTKPCANFSAIATRQIRKSVPDFSALRPKRDKASRFGRLISEGTKVGVEITAGPQKNYPVDGCFTLSKDTEASRIYKEKMELLFDLLIEYHSENPVRLFPGQPGYDAIGERFRDPFNPNPLEEERGVKGMMCCVHKCNLQTEVPNGEVMASIDWALSE